MNPNLSLFAQAAGRPSGPPPVAGQGNAFTPQEMAALGRFGDTTVAHLTPGEIQVPPQVQSPKVLATLKKEFHKQGVHPAQFTAGSPASSVNPSTGMPEYNFLSAILPALLGMGGAALMGPGGAGFGNLGQAVGGGMGNFLGSKLAGNNTQDSLNAGLLAGMGGYMGGNLAPTATVGSLGPRPSDPGPGSMNLGGADAGGPGGGMSASSSLPPWLASLNPAVLGGVAVGSIAGSQSQPQGLPKEPPGFNTPITPMSSLGTPQQLLGQPNYRGARPYIPPRTNLNNYGYGPGQNFFPAQ